MDLWDGVEVPDDNFGTSVLHGNVVKGAGGYSPRAPFRRDLKPGYHFLGAPNASTARASIDTAREKRYSLAFTAALRFRLLFTT